MQLFRLSYFVVFTLLVVPLGLEGQAARSLLLSLRDGVTDEPIQDAFVFFSGSSAGGVSDAAGKVALPAEEYLELVISHLNYETKVLSVAEVENLTDPVILLTPSAIKITEVTVSSSARDANKRKRWLKRFTNAFLGPGRARRGVQIMNPEVLLFQESKAGLRAEARDRVRIQNTALGYEVSFLLDTFLLNPKEEVSYGGKAFFLDLKEQQPAREASWQTARRKSFNRSKTNFFRQLVNDELDQERFELGQGRFSDEMVFQDFTPTASEELVWHRGLKADTLYFSEYLTVADKDIVMKWTNRPGNGVIPAEYATTFLKSRSGRFVVSPTGLLLNNQEVEELGFWADQRVARLLPTNYQTGGANKPVASLIQPHLTALQAHHQAFTQEKVYLHLDKPYYSTGENIWFKAYLLDATGHRQKTASKVVHVELIGPRGKIVRSLALHQDKTLGGNFKLDSTIQAGLYHLRAYTDYMRNGPPEYFFSCTVPVYDPAAIGDGRLSGRSLRPAPLQTDKDRPFTLSIHPEGGTIVAGIENTVAVHLRDAKGEPLEINGQIIDDTETEVTNWATSYDGWGVLKFTPEPNTQYRARLVMDGVSYQVPLARMQVQGLVIHVNNLRDEDVFVKVVASPETSTEGAFMIGHVRGEVFCAMETIVANQDMAFPRSQIPAGMATLSLFSADGQLLAQRVFYNDFREQLPEVQVNMPYAYVRPRQQVRLELSWQDSLFDSGANLSVAITDKSLIMRKNGAEDISSYLLLHSDASQNLAHLAGKPGSLNPKERFLLDLQLTGANWERFTWDDLLQGEQTTLPFPPQVTESVAGYITPKNKPIEREMAEVTLTALHPQPTLMKVVTDSSGNFVFPGLPYLDTVNYILQAARFDERKFNPEVPVLTSKNRKVDIYPTRRSPASLPVETAQTSFTLPPELVGDWASLQLRERALDRRYGSDWQIDLAEVTVTGRKAVESRNFGVFDLNKLDWIAPEKTAYSLLSTLRPGYLYRTDLASNQLLAEVNNGLGKMIQVPVTIIINGSASTFSRFQSLRAEIIDYMVINPTNISVTTREQPRNGKPRESSGIANLKGSGFYAGPDFPAPDYATARPGAERPDLRTTVHWAPDLRLEAGKTSLVSFYAADRETEYEVRIEGITDSGEPVVNTYTIRVME